RSIIPAGRWKIRSRTRGARAPNASALAINFSILGPTPGRTRASAKRALRIAGRMAKNLSRRREARELHERGGRASYDARRRFGRSSPPQELPATEVGGFAIWRLKI